MYRCFHNLFIISSFFILCSSCSNKDNYLFDEDVKELKDLLEWSLNHNPDNLVVQNYRPVSSAILSDMVSLDDEINSIDHNKGNLIAVLYFNGNKVFLDKNQKDLLVLVSKTQIFEDFNILIESNNIKPIMPDIINQIVENLLYNGVKNNHISLNYLSGSNKKLIIKLIKVL